MDQRAPDPVVRAWRESAPFWEKHRETVRAMFHPITTALVDGARIAPGQAVLDVAAGPGEPSLTIAERVGRAGGVLSTDVTAGMLAAGLREARRRGLENIAFCCCSGTALPLRSRCQDAVVCRLGIMFFPDPLTGLTEMLRVLRPGGRLALAVWPPRETSPFMSIPTDVVASHCGPAAPEDPDAPSALRFAEPGKLAQLLERAGARRVTEETVDFRIAAPVRLEEFWPMRSELSELLRGKLAQMPPALAARIAADATAAARPYFTTGRMDFPAQIRIVSGERA
jgi:ubiquinone/menaquinone biosynthesis C-methylase UbiE